MSEFSKVGGCFWIFFGPPRVSVQRRRRCRVKNFALFTGYFLSQTPFYRVHLGAEGAPENFGLVFKEGGVGFLRVGGWV